MGMYCGNCNGEYREVRDDGVEFNYVAIEEAQVRNIDDSAHGPEWRSIERGAVGGMRGKENKHTTHPPENYIQ